ITKCLQQGQFIGGEQVLSFEKQLSSHFNINHIISCGNGTDALQLALMALNLPRGSKIMVPAFSFIAPIEVIAFLGCIPVFYDVHLSTYNADINTIKATYTNDVKAIILVHLFGENCLTEEIQQFADEKNIPIIEDNAQSLGSHNNLSNNKNTITTSFFPTKNLACFGDGGAVLTNDEAIANQIRTIAKHGQADKKYYHGVVGVNSRLDTIQASILSVQLNYLDENIALRRKKALQYINGLKENNNIQLPVFTTTHSFNQFVIRVKGNKRYKLKLFLKEQGIETNIYYPIPAYQQKAYFEDIVLNNTAVLCNEVLALPIYPTLKEESISYICDNINKFFN
ncbi:MAG: DegT/DnrJ/EryC1/StrS family aminotransferase, partial [Chitinophagales bacterium]|nr:DegT/DnrJ/EryC1/StrS family aminotransferase [Chitinophagales bacterium]